MAGGKKISRPLILLSGKKLQIDVEPMKGLISEKKHLYLSVFILQSQSAPRRSTGEKMYEKAGN
jgi:hypothetical protein